MYSPELLFSIASSLPNKVLNSNQKKLLENVEEQFDRMAVYIPLLSRFLVVLTFLEDGFRILGDFSSQVGFCNSHLHMPLHYLVAVLFVTFALVTQMLGSALILANKKVTLGAGLCGSYIFCAFFIYGLNAPEWVHSNGRSLFLIRLVGQSGALVMMACEEQSRQVREKGYTLDLATVDPLQATHRLQLLGRCLIVALCFGVFSHGIIAGLFACILGLSVAIGFRTKMATLVVAGIFVVSMFLTHDFRAADFDTVIYVLCQDLSLLGGLLVLLNNGPGAISLDKKEF